MYEVVVLWPDERGEVAVGGFTMEQAEAMTRFLVEVGARRIIIREEQGER